MDTWRAVQKVLSHKMIVVDKGKTLKFGTAIKLTVEPTDDSTVEPTLFVLRPLQPEGNVATPPDQLGPEVCLATRFRPKLREVVLNLKNGEKQRFDTSNAVISLTNKTYYHATFINRTLLSCEMLRSGQTDGSSSSSSNSTISISSNETAASANNEEYDRCLDFRPEKATLNYFLLVMNGVRIVFTKTLAFNTLLTIRAAFF